MPNGEWEENDQREREDGKCAKENEKDFIFRRSPHRSIHHPPSPVHKEPFCGLLHYSDFYSALLQGDEAMRRSPLRNALRGPESAAVWARGEGVERGGWVGGWGQVGMGMGWIRQKDPGVGGQSSSSSLQTIESSSESNWADGDLGSRASLGYPCLTTQWWSYAGYNIS